MKKRLAAIVLLVAAIAGALFVRTRAPASAAPDAALATAGDELASQHPTMQNDAAFPRAIHDPAKRDELRRRLLAAAAIAEAQARAEASAAAAASAPVERGARQTNDIEEFGRFVAQAIREDFVPMARGCAKDLVARKPDAGGTATIAFELLGDAKLGGVVNDAEIVDAGAPFGDEAFETCIRESMYGVYFDPPPASARATLRFPVTVQAGGIDEGVDDFHLEDKRGHR